MNPLFSIISVSFNSEATIERTIISVLSQTIQDYEYIIVDGASKDRTLDIIKSYEVKFDGKMRWISEPDTGIYNAMNKGIKMAKGEIIGLVNCDDWLERDTLYILSDTLHQNPGNKNKILTGDMLFHYSDGTVFRFSTNFEKFEKLSKRYCMGLNHPATFVPKTIYKNIGLFDERFKLYADADFFIKCYEANVGIIFINKILSNMSDGGVSNNWSLLMLNDSILKINKHAKNNIERVLLIGKSLLVWLIKGFVPQWLLKKYRKYSEERGDCF